MPVYLGLYWPTSACVLESHVMQNIQIVDAIWLSIVSNLKRCEPYENFESISQPSVGGQSAGQ